MLNTYGYVTTEQFDMTGGHVRRIASLAVVKGEDGKTYGPGELFPPGQGEVYLTSIPIGSAAVQDMLNKVVGMLNTAIFSIFDNLKILTTNIQAYFATGLQDDSQAEKSISSARSIDQKTSEVSGVEVD